jgi:hypothetical protein
MRLHNSNYFVFYGKIDDPQIWRERHRERERERGRGSKQASSGDPV